MMDALKNLHQAEATAREALQNSHATANERPHWLALEAAMSDLLAALDAARGEAVGSVQAITSLSGETRKVIMGKAEVIDALPVGTAVYAAPPAAAVPPTEAWPAGDGYPPELDYARAKRGDYRK